MKNHGLNRLIVLARRAYHPTLLPAPAEAPLGFATRIAARLPEQRTSHLSDLWERFCWAGAMLSAVVCLAIYVHQVMTPEPDVLDLVLQVQAGTEPL